MMKICFGEICLNELFKYTRALSVFVFNNAILHIITRDGELFS